jgi:hypothetical protein
MCVIAIGTVVVAWVIHGRIRVTVHNAGARPISRVEARMTGTTTALGEIEPSSVGLCAIRPTRESDLVVAYRDADGASRRVPVDVYVEKGSTGTIDVWIDDDCACRFEPRIWWRGP